MRPRVTASIGLLFVLLFANQAAAYTYETSLSSACHENLTFTALRNVRARGLSSARPPSRGSQALIKDLQFHVPDDMRDIDAVSLVLGNRDNDVKGLSGLNPKDLAEVHGHDKFQPEHCLRKEEHDGEQGDADALAACRAYIRGQALRALSGLKTDGSPDPNATTSLRVFFDFSGQQEVNLPRFYVHAGHALHTLQDSFTHALRDPNDLRRITSVLNWVDAVKERRVAERDGAPHLDALDDCDSADVHVQARTALALEASEALLLALLEPVTHAEKVQRLDAVLDTYLQFEGGCDAENTWCDAPELRVQERSASCAVVRAKKVSGWTHAVLLLLAVVFLRGRRVRTCLPKLSSRAVLPVLRIAGLALTLLVPGTLAAQAQADSEQAQEASAPDGFGFSGRAAASVDRGGFALGLGARYALDRQWWIGLDFEWNPWFSIATLRARSGTLNVYVPLVFRWHQAPELSLRSTLRAGISTLLFDLVGAPSGSVGPCLGINLLGIDVPIGQKLWLVVDPAEVLVAIPQVEGAPIAYVQYRLGFGLVFF